MITLADWHTFHAKLIWAYEGPPAYPSGQFTTIGVKLWLLVQGGVDWTCGEHAGRATAGQWVILPKQMTHQTFDPDSRILSIQVSANWSGGQSIIEVPHPMTLPASAAPELETATRQVIDLVTQLFPGSNREWQRYRGDFDDFLALDQRVLQWVRELVHAAQSVGIEIHGRQILDQRVTLGLQKLDEYPINQKFDRKQYAISVGLSYSQLARLFNEHLGETPTALFERRRLDHARHLLQQRNMLVKQAAYMLGFEDPSHFNRWFKRHCDMSPNEFRSRIGLH